VLTANEILEWDMDGTPAPVLPLLVIDGLTRHFPGRQSGWFHRDRDRVTAVDSVTFTVAAGETLAIIGDAGCGKSTIGRLLVHLLVRDAGRIAFDGHEVGSGRLPLRNYRAQVQMVFQDSPTVFDPHQTLAQSIVFGPMIHGISRTIATQRALALLDRVGLPAVTFAGCYPRDLDDGQRRRANLARALALHPRLLIVDDIMADLEVPVAASIMRLLLDLREELGLTYLLFARDMAAGPLVADRVLTMRAGRIAASGERDAPAPSLAASPATP
jgi:peptide/nickel transport system ATP-binding protein